MMEEEEVSMSQLQTENRAEEDSSLNEREEEEESESVKQKSNTEDRSGNQLLFDDKINEDYRKTRSFRDQEVQYHQSPTRLIFLN